VISARPVTIVICDLCTFIVSTRIFKHVLRDYETFPCIEVGVVIYAIVPLIKNHQGMILNLNPPPPVPGHPTKTSPSPP
jgi:hypothetical protein